MSYRVPPTRKIHKHLRRIARDQIDKAIGEIDDESLNDHDTVHQVRKRMKKVRALARLVRKSFDGYSDANAACRDAARRLSDLRDAKVRVDTFDALVADHADALDEAALQRIRAALLERRDALHHEQIYGERRLRAARNDLEGIRDQIGDWDLDAKGFDAVAGGLAKTYGRGRAAMAAADADPTAEHFHEWRKRTKYHRYHVRLLEDLWPGVFHAWRERLHDLTDLLGDGNDLTELARAGEPLDAAGEDAREVIVALAEHRRGELWEEARELGASLFGDDEGEVVERLGKVWKVAAG